MKIETTYNLDKPWARQPFDTEAKWEAFKAYRDMRQPRSFTELQGLVGKSAAQISGWAKAGGWTGRVLAYDRWRDSHVSEAVMATLEEDATMRSERHIALLRDLQAAAAHVAKGWLKRIQEDPQAVLHEFSPKDVLAIVRDTIKFERLIYGESTENVDAKHTVDLSRLTIDEVKTLRALEVKAMQGG